MNIYLDIETVPGQAPVNPVQPAFDDDIPF